MGDVLQTVLSLGELAPYAALLVVLVLCGLGLPLPEDVPLIAAGILWARGDMDPAAALAVSMVGVLAGDSVVYALGRRVGAAALRSPAIVRRLGPRRVRRMRALYRLRGERVVFFSRFVMGVRVVAFFLAGVLAIRFRRFLLLDGAAALLSVPVWIGLGFWLGRRYGADIERVLEATEPARNAIGAAVAVVAVIVIVRWVRLLRRASTPRPAEG